MNLADLRKVTVKKHLRIRFALSNGMECVLNEHGLAQIPALRAVPLLNLEEELGGVTEFMVESAATGQKEKATVRRYSREELSALAATGESGEAGHDEHDE